MSTWTPPKRLFGSISAANLNTYWRDNTAYIGENLPHHVTMFHDTSLVTNGNAIAANALPGQWYYRTFSQTASADGDIFTQSFWCAAGTYTFTVLCRTTANGGLVDWTLDGGSIDTGMDFYTGGTVVNTQLTIVGASVAVGRHVLTGTVNGQNVASGGYDIEITKIHAVKTA